MIYKKITEQQERESEKLFKYFKEVLKADLLATNQSKDIVEMRSLFNSLLQNKLKFKQCNIQHFYRIKGFDINHATIYNSLNKFNIYCKTSEHLEEIYFELYYYEKKKKELTEVVLTPIQKLVEDLEPWQELELKELIELRIKSWNWKTQNKTKIYTAL